MMNPARIALILERALAGEQLAFEALITCHYDLVYRCASRFCGNRHDAEDVTQEVFLKVAQKFALFDRRSSFATWLYRITINTVRDQQRKKRQAVFVPFDDEKNEVVAPELPRARPAQDHAILQAVDKLPAKLREAVVLVYGEELSHKEAATVLGCAETTVSWRIFQAKRKLRKLLS